MKVSSTGPTNITVSTTINSATTPWHTVSVNANVKDLMVTPAPDKTVIESTDMVVKAIYEKVGDYGQSFTDVPPSHTFFNYIEAIYAAGITEGIGDGKYGPNQDITRGQMARFLVNAYELELVEPEEPSFADVDKDHTFYGYIEEIYDAGITTGVDDVPNYALDENVTRGQMAAFLARALGLVD